MRSFRSVAAACFAGFVAVALAVTGAQQLPPFRGGTDVVYVDAYPRRDGRIVEGLQAADFEVREDGRPQRLELFEFVTAQRPSGPAESGDRQTQADGDAQAAAPRNRVFVVYLDIYHTTRAGSIAAAAPLTAFLTTGLGPSDLSAVTTPERAASLLTFRRSTGLAVAELTFRADWGLASENQLDLRSPYEARLYGCSGHMPTVWRAREDALYVSLESLMVRLGTLKDQRKHLIYVTEGYVARGPVRLATRLAPTGRANAGFQGIGRPPTVPGLPGTTGSTSSPIASERIWCDAEVDRLETMDFAFRYRELLASARAANVAFYPIDVGGLAGLDGCTAADRECRPRPLDGSRVGTLRTLAEETGGIAVVNTNDISGGLRGIVDGLHGYYLLGYSPSHPATGPRYRRIDVAVRRPGVSVSARHGYYRDAGPGAAAARAARAQPGPSREGAAVQEALARLTRLRPDVGLSTYAARTEHGLTVVAEISAPDVERGRWTAGARVRLVVRSPGVSDRTVTGRLEPGSRSVRIDVPLEPGAEGPWTAAVVLDDDTGRVEDRVEIAHRYSGARDPVVFRAPASPRAPFMPAAELAFLRSERVRVQWPASVIAADTRVRILDRNGRPLALTVPFSSSSDGTAAVAELPMAAFAAGDYVLELTPDRADLERTLIAFRVIR